MEMSTMRLHALMAWFERHVIADDPCPTYSRLDRLDGLK